MWVLALAALLLATARAAEVQGSVSGAAGQPLRVVLNGGERGTLLRRDGSFSLGDVPPGVYSLDILSHELVYSQVRAARATRPQFKVQVGAEGDVRVLEFKYPGAPRQAVPHPIQAAPVARA